MTNTDTPAPLTNQFGTPLTFQSLADWQRHVSDIKNEHGLTKARSDLNKGNSLFAHGHAWAFGSEDFFAAHRILKQKAADLGWKWHKGYFKYVKLEEKP